VTDFEGVDFFRDDRAALRAFADPSRIAG